MDKKKRSRILVTLDKDLLETIRAMKGFGERDSERVSNIVFAYLLQNEYIGKKNK